MRTIWIVGAMLMLGVTVNSQTPARGFSGIGEDAVPKRTAPLAAQQTGTGFVAPRGSGNPSSETQPSGAADAAVQEQDGSGNEVHQLFETADKNHDGVLTETEFGQLQSNPEAKSMLESSMNLLSSGKGFLDALLNSVAMIIVTELGDKTFFIAAILAMTNDRSAVYAGALGAVAVMTVLSVVIGFALPALLPRQYTHYAAALLFVFFGIQLLREAPTKNDGVSEELAEVEEELADEGEANDDVEAGASPRKSASRGVEGSSVQQRGGNGAGAAAPSRPGGAARSNAAAALGAGAWVAVLIHAFSLTFVAEWGDRSQIATIAMAAAKEPIGVCIGGVIGHAICTGLAVLGGRLLASRISEKTVTYAGGVLFLLFAAHSLYVGPEAL